MPCYTPVYDLSLTAWTVDESLSGYPKWRLPAMLNCNPINIYLLPSVFLDFTQVSAESPKSLVTFWCWFSETCNTLTVFGLVRDTAKRTGRKTLRTPSCLYVLIQLSYWQLRQLTENNVYSLHSVNLNNNILKYSRMYYIFLEINWPNGCEILYYFRIQWMLRHCMWICITAILEQSVHTNWS